MGYEIVMHHLVSGIHFWVLIYLFLISAQPHVSIFLVFVEVDLVDFSKEKTSLLGSNQFRVRQQEKRVFGDNVQETPALT